MIVTKKAIAATDRVLRGLGATVALPLLDGMVPAFAAARSAGGESPISRFGVIYVPHGAVMANWTPAESGRGVVRAVADPRRRSRRFAIICWSSTGLDHKPAAQLPGEPGGGHGRIGGAFLTGVHAKPTEGADFEAGISIDQIAGDGARPGDAADIARSSGWDRTEFAGACDAGLQLRLHQHALLAHADDAAADGKQSRARCSSGCSAMATPPIRRRAAPACAKDRSLLDAVVEKICRACSGGWARRDRAKLAGVSRLGPRRRAPHSKSRGAERARAAGRRAAERQRASVVRGVRAS